MAHNLIALQVLSQSVVFQCSDCGAQVEFKKPGYGEPAAVEVQSDLWNAPEGADSYLDPCSGGAQ